MVEHVAILGGGIAGLAAAAALTDHVGHVTIVDRDHVGDVPEPRSAVPQSRHVHTLLLRGQRELQALAPELESTLLAAGAPQLDWTEQRLRSAFGWAPQFTSGHRGTFCSRALLEHQLRRSVASREGVTWIEGVEAVGLVGDRGRVSGVRLRAVGRARARAEGGPSENDAWPPARGISGTSSGAAGSGRTAAAELGAQLVIDATGRSSRLPRWLEDLGISAPQESTVTSNLGYASRTISMPPGFAEGWRLMVVRAPRPSTRGGVLYPVEGGRWMVTLAGIGADLPPHDESGFLDFCRTLPGGFGDLVDAGEPLTPIWSYRRTGNRWRRLDRVRAWPDGLLVVGDALCCFNPVYGQGMSVAAAQAGRLRAHMAAGELGAPGSAARVQRSLGALLAGPWSLATGEDFRHPGTVGHRSPALRAAHWYADRVIAATVRDPDVYLRFLEVSHLLRPAGDLATPPMLRRVLGWRAA